jgi:hypothetical protein
LLQIQELFYKASKEKDGPLAGKIAPEQLSPILEKCGQFKFADMNEMVERAQFYFNMLDKDKDTWISFYDFLAPLMPILPPEVATVFTQESRYKTQTFNEIRSAFNAVKEETDVSMFQANVKTLARKLAEKPDP